MGILWLSRWELGPSYIDAILFSSRLIYTALVEVNFIIIMESNIPKKRAKTEPYCLIHCTDDNGKLVSPNSLESWNTLREAGEIRKHEGILSVKVDSDNEVPDGVFYHRKCRSMFTVKRELNSIVAKAKQNEKASLVEESSQERRASIRSNPSTSRVYEKECIFCGKKDKYKKGIKEGLTQARELRVNDSVRKAAISKQDSRILAILSRDLVAAEGHYHRTCYRHYTNIKESDKGEESEEDDDSDYVKAESSALSRMFDYIRNDLFKNNDIIELSKLSEMLRGWILESGVK